LAVILIVPVAVFAFILFRNASKPAIVPDGRVITHVPVIDAGHGGIDGGAISRTGVNESEINLQIAVKADLLMRFLGIPSVMVRTEDISIHDPDAKTVREKKRSDLNNRVKLVQNQPTAVLLSIHQNTFSNPKLFGLQAFYGKAHGSKDLADIIQNVQKTSLDTKNSRQITAVRKDVFLMNNVTCPAVLVECGFLTNADEERRLRDEKYQKKLAAVLVSSFLQWKAEG